MVPNIYGTMWQKNKTENIQDMVEHTTLFTIQQTETQHNPFKKMQ